jgi:hypothetical protein
MRNQKRTADPNREEKIGYIAVYSNAPKLLVCDAEKTKLILATLSHIWCTTIC